MHLLTTGAPARVHDLLFRSVRGTTLPEIYNKNREFIKFWVKLFSTDEILL
jgi:hypothetical protein